MKKFLLATGLFFIILLSSTKEVNTDGEWYIWKKESWIE